MKLYKHILIKVLLPLVLSSITMVIVSTVVISYNLSAWTGDIGITLGNAEIENLNNRIVNLQKLMQDIYKQINSDTLLLEEYYLNILANYTGNQYYTSYSLVTAIDPNAPVNNTDASGYYESGGSSSYKNSTTLLDDVFRSVYLSNQKYLQLYVGFEDGFFRKYPFQRADNYPTFSYVCITTGMTVIGYQPQCRSWYQLAKSTPNQVVFTPPYLLASTKKVAITSAKALILNGAFIGVAGIDITMEIIDQILVGDTVLLRGYSYVIDNTGVLVFYPGLNRSQLYTITDYEGVTLTNTTGNMTYSKTGESWLLVYSAVPNTTYIVCISVPWSDIEKSKLDLDSQSSTSLKVVIAVAVVVLLLLTFMGIWASRKISIKIITPLRDLTIFVEKLGKQDFDQDLQKPREAAHEILHIYDNFTDLLEAIKFGNQAYHNGNWDLAMANYGKVENLMKKTLNQRGLGIVYSNKANTMRLIPGTADDLIVQEYKKAIEIAEHLIQNNNEKYDEKLLQSNLGDRLMNFGVYFMEKKVNATAEEYFDRGLKIHKANDNSLGISKTTGNLAQLYIQAQNYEAAEDLLTNLISYAEKRNDTAEEVSQRLLQYAYMNYGRLRLAKNNYDEAAICFVKSLNSAKVWEKQVAIQCASKLLQYHERIGNHTQVGILQDIFPVASSNDSKHVNFVLDTSGSMMSIIDQCRKSIIAIVKKLTKNDSVSLYTFNTTVKSIFVDYRVGEKLPLILEYVETHTNVDGRTAFYQALFESMKKSHQHNDWIVALTDGEDNASSISASNIVQNYSEYLNIVIITVGKTGNEKQIHSICEEAKKHGKKGLHITTSDSHDKIADAFVKAGDMMLRGDVVQQEL